jgi:hypothetical protein
MSNNSYFRQSELKQGTYFFENLGIDEFISRKKFRIN